MRLATKLIALFLLFSLVPFLVVSVGSYHTSRQAIEAVTLDRLQSINLLKEAEFNRWVQGNERSLRELARRPLVQLFTAEIIALDDLEASYTLTAHESLHEDHLDPTLLEGGFIELFIMHPDTGQILISTTEGEFGKYRQNESYFLGGKTATTIQNFYYALSRGEPVMTIATPLLDKQGNLIAVIAGHVSPVEMSNIMTQSSGATTTEETFLVNKFNFFSSESRFEVGYAFIKAIRTVGVEACLEQKSGSGYYESYQESVVFGVYRWLPERELCILTEIDQAEAFAPILAQRNALIGVGLGIGIILVLTVTFFARTITQPVLQLVSGAQKIGQGQLNHQINVKTKDEIGQLATEFNAMAANLSKSNDSLNKRLNFERLVSELSIKFISLPSEQIDEAINLALAEIAQIVGANRGAVFLFSGNPSTLSNTHEWSADPADSQMALLQNIPPEAIGYYWQFLQRHENIVIGKPEDLPTDAVNEWGWREKHGFRPLLLVPMLYQNELYGAIGFYGAVNEEREWSEEFLSMTRLTTDIFISALERKKTEAELHRHRDELTLLVAERTSELENSLEKLTKSNEELAQFAYVASHDLQEPLRMVSSYMQLLSRRYQGKLDEEADEFIGFAVDGAQRMQGLINDLLAFSRVGTRGQELIPTDSQTVLDQTLRNLQIAIAENQANIVSDPMPTVMGDAGQLGQLFQNLISNALKFRSDVPVEIHIGVEPQNGDWLFSVRDNGIGIEPQYRERIFAIFQRLHTRKEYSGTGIGLAVCKKIVERHNGRIWVESALGKGSTFYFTLQRSENHE